MKISRSIHAIAPVAVVVSTALLLGGCASTPTGNGAPEGGVETDASSAVFEFQTPTDGSEGELVLRIPEALAEAAKKHTEQLVTQVTANARDLDSSEFCAVDLDLDYAKGALEYLDQPKETEAEHIQAAADELEFNLESEFGLSTVDEVRATLSAEGVPEEQIEEMISEFETVSDIGPYKVVREWMPLNGLPTSELDESDPTAGQYISKDLQTVTFVQPCAVSPVDDDYTTQFSFPAETVDQFDDFAVVDFGVMKNGTLLISDSEVADYTLDTNGDWIGGASGN